MNKRAESVKFVVMLTAALIIIGVAFVSFAKNPSITSRTTYTQKACFVENNGKLTSADVVQCCTQIKQSSGCSPYQSSIDGLYICKGDRNVVVNKDTIEFCS